MENPNHPFPHSNLLQELGGQVIPPYVSPTETVCSYGLFIAMKVITMIEQNTATLRNRPNGIDMGVAFNDSNGNHYSFSVMLSSSQLSKVENWEQSMQSTFAVALGNVISGDFVPSDLALIPVLL